MFQLKQTFFQKVDLQIMCVLLQELLVRDVSNKLLCLS